MPLASALACCWAWWAWWGPSGGEQLFRHGEVLWRVDVHRAARRHEIGDHASRRPTRQKLSRGVNVKSPVYNPPRRARRPVFLARPPSPSPGAPKNRRHQKRNARRGASSESHSRVGRGFFPQRASRLPRYRPPCEEAKSAVRDKKPAQLAAPALGQAHGAEHAGWRSPTEPIRAGATKAGDLARIRLTRAHRPPGWPHRPL